jgi:hypothetical protein
VIGRFQTRRRIRLTADTVGEGEHRSPDGYEGLDWADDRLDKIPDVMLECIMDIDEVLYLKVYRRAHVGNMEMTLRGMTRDRSHQSELRAAIKRGEKYFNGQITKSWPSEHYVSRWSKEMVIAVLERNLEKFVKAYRQFEYRNFEQGRRRSRPVNPARRKEMERTATESLKLTGICAHGIPVTTEIFLPMSARAFDCSEPGEEGSDFIVWLVAADPDQHVVPVTMHTTCERYAHLIAEAMNTFLATDEGQQVAIEHVKRATSREGRTPCREIDHRMDDLVEGESQFVN